MLAFRGALRRRLHHVCKRHYALSAYGSKELKYMSADEAVEVVKSGDSVFVHGAAMTPTHLVKALAGRAHPSLTDVKVVSIHTEGENPLVAPEAEVSFRANALFMGANVREAVAAGRADATPCFLSEIPSFFRKDIIPVDVAMIQVSPPDKHGYCSLGTSVDVAVAACEKASTIIAQVNPNVPRTHGDSLIHVSFIEAAVEVNDPVHHDSAPEILDIHHKIGANIAALVEDGATIQAGIGVIPDAALLALKDHKDLGVHTEMFSDGLLGLVKDGIVTNKFKKNYSGKIVTSFSVGSRDLMDFVDDNPDVLYLDVSHVNDTAVIRQNPKVTAINSAVEVDLTGQVVADSVGSKFISGVGGQMDFVRGASLSEGGKPIIAFTSRSEGIYPKIVPTIHDGAGVVTTRAHVHHIVTEYGAVDLYGKSARERAKLLISIAHPDDREALEKAAFERFKAL
mmetsp:Transcript_9494/g.35543  ORF Transcript_9494/g.35543 Transcript_9494/m.35543 type:complete len:454 (-) Transcript_9494:297-1658(-)